MHLPTFSVSLSPLLMFGLWLALGCNGETTMDTMAPGAVSLEFVPRLVEARASQVVEATLNATLSSVATRSAEGVELVASLPAGVELVGSDHALVDTGSGALRWKLARLEPGGSWGDQLRLKVTTALGGPVVIQVSERSSGARVKASPATLTLYPPGQRPVERDMGQGVTDMGVRGEDTGLKRDMPVAAGDTGVEVDQAMPPKSRGSGQAFLLGRTDRHYFDLEVTRTPAGWLLTDTVQSGDFPEFTLREGYQYWYYINGVIHKTKTPLKDYLYASDGVLDVRKAHYKETTDVEARWSDDPYPWHDKDASYTFGPRGDVGGQSVWFLDYDDEQKGNIQWLDRTPDWYGTGSDTFSWPVKAPPMPEVESGKAMAFYALRTGVTNEDRFNRGETFVHDPDYPDVSKRQGHVLGTGFFGITSPNESCDYFRQKGQMVPLTGMATFELSEGDVWLPQESEQLACLVGAVQERYEQAGRSNYILMATYGGYGLGTPDQDLFWRYSVTPEELRQRDSYLRWAYPISNAVSVKHYGTSADTPQYILHRIGQAEAIKKAGMKAIMFGWHHTELVGLTGYVSGFGWETELTGGGIVLTNGLSLTPFDETVAHGFIGFWWGDGLWVWEGFPVHNPDPDTIGPAFLDGHTTFRDGGNLDGMVKGSAHQPAPDIGIDGYYIGAYLYRQTRDTFGGDRRYIPFEIDGKQWSIHPDGADAIQAMEDERGIAQIRTKGNTATLVYYNPYADNAWHTLKVKVGGKTFTSEVFGRRLHVANLSL